VKKAHDFITKIKEAENGLVKEKIRQIIYGEENNADLY